MIRGDTRAPLEHVKPITRGEPREPHQPCLRPFQRSLPFFHCAFELAVYLPRSFTALLRTHRHHSLPRPLTPLPSQSGQPASKHPYQLLLAYRVRIFLYQKQSLACLFNSGGWVLAYYDPDSAQADASRW